MPGTWAKLFQATLLAETNPVAKPLVGSSCAAGDTQASHVVALVQLSVES
jgi:hypothetical protein